MNTIKKFLAASLASVAVLAFGSLAFAQNPQCDGAKAVGVAACNDSAFTSRIDSVINAVFFIAGVAAVLVLIAGGVGYIMSTGDATRITKAKNTIMYAVIGLIIVILARAIVGFVVGRVG